MDHHYDVARAICRKEGLGEGTLRPLSGGQTNLLFVVDGRYVIRLAAEGGSGERLEREAELIRALEGQIPVPSIRACGRHEGAAYQVQQFVPGGPLHRAWRGLAWQEKDRIVGELAEYLKILHSSAGQGLSRWRGGEQHTSWLALCEAELRAALADVERLGLGIAPGFVALAARYFDCNKQALEDSVPALVHGDLWPGNVLIRNGRIAAILDWESARQAPKDYELLRLEQFGLYPNDYAAEGDEVYCTGDFGDLFQLLRKHYPELFAIPRLRERLGLYHVLDGLSSYVGWAKGSPEAARQDLPIYPVAKISNIILDHGARMFYR